MIETVFRTDELPVTDRFDHWVECIGRSHTPMEMYSDHAAEYWGYHRVLSLGAVNVWPTTYHPVRYQRTPRLIRQSDPEGYTIALPIRGTNGVAWDDDKALYGPDEFYVVDSSRPFELDCRTDDALCASVGICVPKSLLPQFGGKSSPILERGFPARHGVGALLARFVDDLCTDTASFQPSDGPRLGATLIDLVAAMFAQALDAERVLDPATRRRTLVQQIHAFIQRHLADPDLTPRSIAAAHHISLSHLHQLFQDEDLTVAAWIRHQRLERAHHDLADQSQRATPIHAIAARWGFPRPADFTRAFRETYGIPPKEHRHQTLRTHPSN